MIDEPNYTHALNQTHNIFLFQNLFTHTQNATIASPVFQVIASDPDNPSTPSGMLTFSIQDDNEDAKTFRIGMEPLLIVPRITVFLCHFEFNQLTGRFQIRRLV